MVNVFWFFKVWNNTSFLACAGVNKPPIFSFESFTNLSNNSLYSTTDITPFASWLLYSVSCWMWSFSAFSNSVSFTVVAGLTLPPLVLELVFDATIAPPLLVNSFKDES